MLYINDYLRSRGILGYINFENSVLIIDLTINKHINGQHLKGKFKLFIVKFISQFRIIIPEIII